MVDNLDSFTGSLVALLRVLGAEVREVRADRFRASDLDGVDRVLLSPGPGRPSDFPVNLELARNPPVPVFGVCLGMQALGEAWGARVRHAPEVVHGRTSPIRHQGAGVFRGLPSPLRATRYHSLCVDPEALPACLEVTAWVADGTIMGLRHRTLPVEGVQFHPESVATRHGAELLANALAIRAT